MRAALVGLSATEGATVLSTTALTEAEKIKMLTSVGVAKSEAKQAIATVSLSTAQTGAAVTTNAFTATLVGLKTTAISADTALKALVVAHPILTAIAATVTLGAIAFDAFHTSVDEAKDATEDAREQYESTKTELEQINSELETNKQRIDELRSSGTLTYVEQQELEKLKESNELLRIQAERKKAIADADAQNLAEKSSDQYDVQYGDFKDLGDKSVQDRLSSAGEGFLPEIKSKYDIAGYIANIQNNTKLIDETKASLRDTEDLNENEVKGLNTRLQGLIDGNKEMTDELKDRLTEFQQLKLDMADGYANAKEKQKNHEDLSTDEKNIISNYEQLGTSIDFLSKWLDPANFKTVKFEEIFDTSGLEKTKEELIQMSKEGKLDSKTIDSYKNLSKAISDSGISMGDFIKQIRAAVEESDDLVDSLDFTSVMSGVQELQDGFDELDKVYADVYDGGEFDWSSILNNDKFDDAFGSMGESYDNFIKTISSNSTDIEACRQAFNDLVTEYIWSSDTLKNLSAETRDSAVAFLEQQGVVNASAIVDSYLAAQQEYVTLTGKDMADVTAQDALEFINMGKASEEAKSYLAQLYLSKLDINSETINTNTDVENIIAIANAAGTSTQYVDALRTALNNLASAKTVTSKASGVGMPSNLYDLSTKKYKNIGEVVKDPSSGMTQKQAEDAFNNIMKTVKETSIDPNKFKGNYQGGSKTSKAKSKANKSSGDSGSKGSSSKSKEKEPTVETFDLIERAIKRVQRVTSNLKNVVSATYKVWSTRNSALLSEINSINSEISTQQNAYNAYMAKANSVGLNWDWQNKIANGQYSIEDVTDDTLKKQIKDYQTYIDKANEAADAVQELRNQVAELAKTKFDNLEKEFKSQIDLIKHESDMYNKFIDQAEAQGRIASTTYYSALIGAEQKNIKSLENEYASLTQQMADSMARGNIEKYSEAWYEMQNAINEVAESLEDANKSLIEYQNNLRETPWNIFDKQEDYISKLTDEASFLVDLLSSNRKLIDDATGKMNSNGLSVQGLHAVSYNVYMAQADQYKEAILEVNKELANDPYNTKIIERRQELLKLQQDAIKNAESEKSSIKDLISESYNAMLSALQKLIDKRKELLNADKEQYQYQKTVRDQVDTIASYRKQLMALQGDDSEETQSKIQTANKSLKDAEESLKETEYEKWVSDTEKMLDILSSEFEELINKRLDDLDLLIQMAVDATNQNAVTISDTIQKETEAVGYTLSSEMQTIWKSSDGLAATVTNGLDKSTTAVKDIVSVYGQDFQKRWTTTNDALNGIKVGIDALVKDANVKAQEKIKQAQAQQAKAQATVAKASTPAPAPKSTPKPASNPAPAQNTSSQSSGNFFVYQKDSYAKGKLDKERSIVDRLKWHDYASAMNYRRTYYEKMGLGSASSYRGTAKQNNAMLNWMRARGYAHGTYSATPGWHAVNENGIEAMVSNGKLQALNLNGGEQIFSAPMTEALWNLAKGMTTGYAPGNIKNIAKHTNTSSNNNIAYNITLPNVQNYDQFKSALIRDPQFEKSVTQMTIGNAMGGNTLKKLSF